MAWERSSLPPMSLSAPSCNAGVYAHCRLKTIETGDDRPLVVLWVVKGLLPLGLLLLFAFAVTLSGSIGHHTTITQIYSTDLQRYGYLVQSIFLTPKSRTSRIFRILTRRMAIAKGTCVSFCNQPKAHFGLLWGRPWDNCGKCHMDEKRIQCLSNASIFNRFPVIQPVSSKVRHFTHFGLPWVGYAPWTLAVNVTWMERGFNDMLVKRIAALYPSIFNRLRDSEILVGSCNFFLPLAFNAPVGGVPIGIPGKIGAQKTRIMGLPGSEDSLTIG